MNLSMQQTHGHAEQIHSCFGGGMVWQTGVGRCKLLHMEWINNKVLPYSTENYIQFPMINHNGTEYEKECMCIDTYI